MADLPEEERKALFKQYAKSRIILISASKNDRKQIRNVLRDSGLTDIVEMESCGDAWEKLNLASANILIFSLNEEGADDFFNDLAESVRFADTPLVIYSDKVTELSKIHANRDLKIFWRSEPMNGLDVERAVTQVFQKGSPGKSRLDIEDISLGNYTKGVKFLIQGKFDEAKEALRIALKENPNFVEAYVKMGEVLMALGLFGPAKRVLERAEQIAPGHPQVLARMIDLSAATNEKEKALQEFSAIIEKRSDDPMLIITAGNAALNKGWIDESIELFEKARAIDPNLIHVYNRLGMAHSRAKRFDKAMAMYEKALSYDKEDAGVTFNIGVTHYRMGNFDAAIAQFTKAGRFDPSLAEPAQWIEKANAAKEGRVANPGASGEVEVEAESGDDESARKKNNDAAEVEVSLD